MASNSFCAPCDESQVLSARYDLEHCEPQLQQRGIDRFLIFACDASFENILDPAEWKTLIAEGKIFQSPCGSFTKQSSTTDILFDYPCGGSVTDCVTHSYQYQSPAAADDYSDELWWCRFNEQIGSRYTIAPLYCKDDRIVLPKVDVEGINAALLAGEPYPLSSIGYKLSLTESADFVPGPNNKHGLWQFTGDIENATNLISVEIPDLAQCIADAEAALGGGEK